MTTSAHSIDRAPMSRYLATARMRSRAIRSHHGQGRILPAQAAAQQPSPSTRIATTRDRTLSVVAAFGAESLQS